ncbi:Mannose-1-phosphate guanyltransferase [Gossypium australe]|uniref:Mannose-1-phosphate guanyltransferase n=1 Tax=Gossypium australe TaxID=47621 RepID=A0A5B6WD63_9ROSI|nr:Mannose-1-phosphate guanyltransferase [Gossypium australe]
MPLPSDPLEPLQCPDKLMEQAKAIVDNSSELLNLDMSSSDAEVLENPRERRPALGRKRPLEFDCTSSIFDSLPTKSLEPSIDIDNFNDPEEFFVAFEKAENAKREIEKQTGGVLMDLDQNIQSMAARSRRPGILRFDQCFLRSVKYKHRYSTPISPVESFEEEIPSPVCNSQPEKSDQNVELQEELSVTNAENKVNELLDRLLTSTFDGDEAISLLQEQLQIKPIDLEKICLPDLQDIRRIDLKASRENLAKPRNSLSDIESLFKGISKRTPKRKAESSVHLLASPTPPRSPLASISLLRKQKLQSDVPSDPFSTDDVRRSPVRNASGIESNNKESAQVDTEKELSVSHNNDRRTPQQQPESSAHHLASPSPPRDPLASISLLHKQMMLSDPESEPFSTDSIHQPPKRNASPIESVNKQSSQVHKKEHNNSHLLRSPLLEANQTATANASSELDGRDFAGLFDKFVNDNARRFDSRINVVSSGSQANLENNSLRRPEVASDSHTIKPNEFGGRVEDIPPEAVVSTQTQVNVEGLTIDNSGAIQKESGCHSAFLCFWLVLPVIVMRVSSKEIFSFLCADSIPLTDESSPAIDEDRSMNGSLKAAESGEQLHEGCGSVAVSVRCSGTTFDPEGRRRSTRIRSRPLEFWKGERFLYGRVHSSLATVIGIKYESPEKGDGGNPTLKVKSFVSDEYKELIELAARF